MKYSILLFVFLAGCASSKKILMKNCERVSRGSQLFYCEEIPKKELGGRQR